MRTSTFLRKSVDAIEGDSRLDGASAALQKAVSTVIKPGPVEDVLSGTPAGHPLHPALVAVPIGAWVGSAVLDLTGDETGARRLVGLGLLSALPTAASGASDWASLHQAEQRVGLVHALLNYAGLGAFGVSWVARGRAARRTGRVASTVGLALIGAAGYLGGHLSYAQGVGVDTTAFTQLPDDWTAVDGLDAAPADGELATGTAAGVPVVVARVAGSLSALADRCTHRGAPLHEGSLEDGCLHCPWHDSVFDARSGDVVSGPATRPQPAFDVRERDGRVEVRLTSDRALRTNAAGV